jgi:ATP-dependent DNA helicase PIF1
VCSDFGRSTLKLCQKIIVAIVNPQFSLKQMVLIDIRNMLQSMGKDIRSFTLPEIDDMYDNANGSIPQEIFEETSIKPNPNDVSMFESLNGQQRAAYNEIMSSIEADQGRMFFVDGPGGTGKTTSGVAASIMLGGRAAHSCFKIPLTIEDGGCCSFTKQSGTSKLLRQAALIIWDKASMNKRQAVQALDNSL